MRRNPWAEIHRIVSVRTGLARVFANTGPVVAGIIGTEHHEIS